MRLVTAVLATSLGFALSGCQHIHLMNTTSTTSTTAEAQPQPTLLRQLLAHHAGGQSIQDYPAACLAHSKLNQPMVIGQVIDTPRYAMLTLAKQHQPTEVMGGELCILNKINHHVEITAVDDLRFMTPTHSTVAQAE